MIKGFVILEWIHDIDSDSFDCFIELSDDMKGIDTDLCFGMTEETMSL
jgi:hypothetical protein